MILMNLKSRKKIPGVVIMLGIVSLFTDSASEMIYPLIPVYITALGSGAIMLGVIEGIAETTASLLKLVSGVISDKTGKRKLLVLTGYTISSLITASHRIGNLSVADYCDKNVRPCRKGNPHCSP